MKYLYFKVSAVVFHFHFSGIGETDRNTTFFITFAVDNYMIYCDI